MIIIITGIVILQAVSLLFLTTV